MTILEKDKRGEIDVKREYRERFYNYTNWKKDFIPTDWDCISPCSGLHTLDDEYEGSFDIFNLFIYLNIFYGFLYVS